MTHNIIIILSLVIYFVNSTTIKVETKGGNNWWYYVQVLPEGTRTDTTVQIESEGAFITLASDTWAYETPLLTAQLVLPLGIKLIRGNAEIYVPNLITDYEIGKIYDLGVNFGTHTTTTTTTTTPPPSTTTTTTTTPPPSTTTTTTPPPSTTTTSTPPPPSTTTTTTTPPPSTTTTSTPVDTIKVKARGSSWWYAIEVLPEVTRADTTVEIESPTGSGVFITLLRHSWAYATEPLSTELELPLGIRLTRDGAAPIYVPHLITQFEPQTSIETLFDLGVNFDYGTPTTTTTTTTTTTAAPPTTTTVAPPTTSTTTTTTTTTTPPPSTTTTTSSSWQCALNTPHRCGTDWTDANSHCKACCIDNGQCPTGEACFADINQQLCQGTVAPTGQTSSPSPAPTIPTVSPIPTRSPIPTTAMPTRPWRNPRDYRISTVSGCGVGKRVSLTFDDGPAATHGETLAILDALDARGIKGTFFVSPASWGDDQTGLNARCLLIAEITDRGHEVQSHSWSHPDFTTLDNTQMLYQLNTVSDFIVDCGGVRPNMFRPPYGSLNKEQAEFIVGTLGYVISLWNLDSNDWRNPNDASFITGELRLQEYPQSSINVLFHDRSSYAVIDEIIGTFENANYEFILQSECWNGCDDSWLDADGVCMDYTPHSNDPNWFYHNQEVLLQNSYNSWRN